MSVLPPELTEAEITARFAWGRRNGHANWLWPDIAITDWRNALADIVAATRAVVAGQPARLHTGDTTALSLAAYTSCMGPLLGYWLSTGQLLASPAATELLAAHLEHNRARMQMLAEVARNVSASLAAAGLHPMLVKGMHTAFAYFPDPATRPVTDIDIHLPPDEIAAAESVLRRLGYEARPCMQSPYMCDWILPQTRYHPASLTWLHRDDPWALDVQASLDRRLTTGQRVRLDRLAADIAALPWSLSADAVVAAQPLLALLLAAHMSQELRSATLLRVYELAMVFRRDIPRHLSWHDLMQAAALIGGPRFIYPALYFCNQLAPALIPSWVLDQARTDAPVRLRAVLDSLTLETAQPLARYALSEKFMWVGDWGTALGQFAYHLGASGRARPLAEMPAQLANKFWILLRGRLRA